MAKYFCLSTLYSSIYLYSTDLEYDYAGRKAGQPEIMLLALHRDHGGEAAKVRAERMAVDRALPESLLYRLNRGKNVL